MNKKGFTLIEVLAVVVILGLLAVILTPTVKNLINDSEETVSKQQINTIITATQKYMVEHSELLPEMNEDSKSVVYIGELIENGVLEGDKIIDPKTKENIDGCVVIKYNIAYNQYEYEYQDSKNQNECNPIIVTFDAQGGTVDKTTKKVAENGIYGELPTPTREGYTFKGWNGKNIIDKSKSSFVEIQNETPFSHWAYPPAFNTEWVVNNIKPNTQYSISFDVEGISVPDYDTKYSGNLGFFLYSMNSDKTLYPSRVIYDNKYINEGEIFHSIKSFITPSNVNLSESRYTFYVYTNRYEKDGAGVYSTIRIYNLQLEEGNTATPFEPYYITSNTTVVQDKNHTLKAIWEKNE